MQHIVIAKVVTDCYNCGRKIGAMQYHFVKYRTGGKYMGEIPAYRVHLNCATKEDMCCKDGYDELKKHIGKGNNDE